MKEADVDNVSNRRKKLWEIERYHCSIIGTCFSRPELRKIAKHKEFALSPELPDYQLHTALVNLAAEKRGMAKALHKMLDRKFGRVVNRFAKVKSEAGVRELWQQNLARGALAGPYWAVLTHPATSTELAAEAHGEIHMIGHDFTAAYQLHCGRLERLRLKQKQVVTALDEEKKKFRQVQQTLEEEKREQRLLQVAYDRLQNENESLRQKVLKLTSRPQEHDRLADRELISRLQQDNAMLSGQVDQQLQELDEAREMVELTEMTITELSRANERLRQEKNSFEQEVSSLEATLMAQLLTEAGCANCANQNTEACPGPGLCGRTVLYVGGLHKMVPYYRELIEKHGGVFVHHDGGRESSKAMLPKLLSGADAVLCPVDCVSHNACKNVKKICKRYQKPFVMMRSSGLSSLAKGLSEIMVLQ